eukprot:scaffold8130_cov164-Amphora_coffeaeformis.AAC.3
MARKDERGLLFLVSWSHSGGRDGWRTAGNSNSARQQVVNFWSVPPLPRFNSFTDDHHDEAPSSLWYHTINIKEPT